MTQRGSKKSRKGCARCKARRVKCDEHAPCGNCARRGDNCSLASTVDPQTEWLQDMELWYHYTAVVAHHNFGLQAHIASPWKDTIPQAALQYPSLLHALLALSALHIAYIRPAELEKYLALCDRHNYEACSGLRSALAGPITPHISSALFPLSSAVSIISMGRSKAVAALRSGPAYVDMDDVAELFGLASGVREVLFVTAEHVRHGPLRGMIEGHTMPEDHIDHLPPLVRDQFDRVEAMLHETCGQDLSPCLAALKDLEEIYLNVRYFSKHGTVETGQVARWFVMVPKEFATLVQARRAPALIILAYFAAACAAVTGVWYKDGWGQCCLQGIRLSLTSMHEWLDWPQRQAENRLQDLR